MKRKRKRTNITDLNVDMLKHIMIFVAKSSGGAGSFARAISVCKAFTEFAEDADILKAVVFENGRVSGHEGSFWQINGLLNKCARAGNMAASHILLMHLEERVGSSWTRVETIEWAKKNFIERMVAVKVVFTRARMRAATLARDELIWMIQDFLIDFNEISELLVGIKFAAIAENG